MGSRTLITACIVATVAFAAYTRTLLPGVDLGDTGGFQAAVLWPEISARQAYPLYNFLAKPFVAALTPDEPARGLNLFSAVCAALAAGILTAVVGAVTGSVSGGAIAGLLLAFSFTFWTQAVIAEVYSLHLLLVGCSLVALIAWWRRPTTRRLAIFFAIYALGFGNHLSMILLFVPFAVFVLMTANHPTDVMRAQVIALAIAIAAIGALQYLPELLALCSTIGAPERWTDRLAAFWFDVTKSDWRESMVLGIGARRMPERFSMFAFDARQQVGWVGLALAAVGIVSLWRTSRPWAVLLMLAYIINTGFAITYNVGDPHVFFLPGHYFVAFSAGAAIAGLMRLLEPRRALAYVAAGAVLGYAGWRGYDTWPAADRHADRRAERLVTRLTMGLDDRNALLAAQLNWQVENALLYETRYRLKNVTWTRLSDVLPYFPILARDNLSTGRDVVLTAAAMSQVSSAFGPLFPIVADRILDPPSLRAYVARIPRGALYVLTILAPSRDEMLNDDDVGEAIAALTGGHDRAASGVPYEMFVGRAGSQPLLYRRETRPFRAKLNLAEGALDVRMEGWVPFETFRRAGFGHVLLDRRTVLTIERGLSLTTIGAPDAFYTGNVYALQPRFRIPVGGVPQLALLH